MAAFHRADGKTALVRNHELGGYTGAFTTPAYDPLARGGTTNLVFDPKTGKFTESWASLSGTIRNCAGGPTPWGTWLTCEETTEIAEDSTRHGYVFEVPFDQPGDPSSTSHGGRLGIVGLTPYDVAASTVTCRRLSWRRAVRAR